MLILRRYWSWRRETWEKETSFTRGHHDSLWSASGPEVCLQLIPDPGRQEPGRPLEGAGTPELSHPESWPEQSGACPESTPHPQTWQQTQREKVGSTKEREKDIREEGRTEKDRREIWVTSIWAEMRSWTKSWLHLKSDSFNYISLHFEKEKKKLWGKEWFHFLM